MSDRPLGIMSCQPEEKFMCLTLLCSKLPTMTIYPRPRLMKINSSIVSNKE